MNVKYFFNFSPFNFISYHTPTKIYKTTNYTVSYIYLFKIENMVKRTFATSCDENVNNNTKLAAP